MQNCKYENRMLSQLAWLTCWCLHPALNINKRKGGVPVPNWRYSEKCPTGGVIAAAKKKKESA